MRHATQPIRRFAGIMHGAWLVITGLIVAVATIFVFGSVLPDVLRDAGNRNPMPSDIQWCLDHPFMTGSLGVLIAIAGAMAIAVRPFRWPLVGVGSAILLFAAYLILRGFVLSIGPAYEYQPIGLL